MYTVTINRKMRPSKVCLEASNLCQLRCPLCPTGVGKKLGIRRGYLKMESFKKFVDGNPWISEIELSNWGEIFLNPELPDIIKYAYEKKIMLMAENGVNLNTIDDKTCEALVKYRFKIIVCSIDGASQQTYKMYRIGGDFNAVINNIKRINSYKNKYKSKFPLLQWQFIIFGHNEHEIAAAKRLAKDLNMESCFKLSGNESFFPVQKEEFVKRETGLGVVRDMESCFKLSGNESFFPVQKEEFVKRETGLSIVREGDYFRKKNKNYRRFICISLWNKPQINWDGEMLGCCLNYSDTYGNVFNCGLLNVINNDKMDYARAMLMGKKTAKEDIICSRCRLYRDMQRNNRWLTAGEVLRRRWLLKAKPICLTYAPPFMIHKVTGFTRKKRI
ncbi:MAG: SPASM domain-containing protein [Candidatus Omnitrophica bacterium]|nr:SPASM domain-containing protein [Candidatus Omnitrophota bacterium]